MDECVYMDGKYVDDERWRDGVVYVCVTETETEETETETGDRE